MDFDFDQLINQNFQQVLIEHLNVTSLDDYDVNINQLLQNDNKFFTTHFNLTYNFTLLTNNILNLFATSKTYCNQKFSLSNQNHVKKIYESNSIDFETINHFKTTESVSEFKSYAITVSKKVNTSKDTELNLFLQIKQNKTYISTTPFIESFIIDYKINKDINNWHLTLKKHLLESYKEDLQLPNRDARSYKKIEKFKPYELTYKIFYEMAIRNDNVKKIMNALDYLYDIRSLQKTEVRINKIDCIVNNDEKTYKLSGTLNIKNLQKDTKVFTSINNSNVKCIETIKDNQFEVEILQKKDTQDLNLFIAIGADNYQTSQTNFGLPITHSEVSIRTTTAGVKKDNKKNTISIKIDTQKYSIEPIKDANWTLTLDKNNNNDMCNSEILINKYKDFLNPEEHKIYFSIGLYVINELIKEFEAELINNYHIYPKNYDVDHPERSEILFQRITHNAFDVYKLQNDPTYIHQDKYFFKQDDYDGYSVYQGILKDEDKRYNLSTIKQDATKQVVDDNISNLQLNLNLPKDELIAYLSKIKDNYDNNNSIIATPLELKDEELNIEYEKIKHMKSIEWADTFYMYDYFKSNKNDNFTRRKDKIQENLNKHYCINEDLNVDSELDYKNPQNIAKRFSKVNTSDSHHLGIETITTRIKLMEKLIDNKKYKVLTTKSKILEEEKSHK